ncbi:MAG: helix-turn-helix domain-containing protein [Patescibacteria group bacterium]
MTIKTGKILKSLGLTDGEIKTYLSALRLGPSSVLDLSTATGLTRQSTYNATQHLTELSLMDSSLRGNISVFSAENPAKLLDFAKIRQNEMNSLVSDLENLIPKLEREAGGDKPAVVLLEGKEGLLEAISIVLDSAHSGGYEMVDFSAVQDTLNEGSNAELVKMIMRRGVRDTTAIFTSDIPSDMKSSVKHSVTLPDQDGNFRALVCAFEKKIVLVSFRGRSHTVVIEDELMASALRLIFKNACANLAK